MIRDVGDLSAERLTLATGVPVGSFEVEQIGTGQMSDCYRVRLDSGSSVVLKVAASDPTSRATGAALGIYEREVRFYSDVAPLLGDAVAPCHDAAFDPHSGTFHLLIGDAAPARQGDDVSGAPRTEAELAARSLAALHAPLLGRQGLHGREWLKRESPISQELINQLLAGFLERYAERIAPEHRLVCERLAGSFDAWTTLADTLPQGLVHGDYRLDNMLFGEPGSPRRLTVVDWQTVSWGPVLADLAYFLGCALTIEHRRAWEDDLLAAYRDALGAVAPSLQDCNAGLRHQAFYGVMMAIISPMLVARTDRGDEMFMTMVERHAQHVLDRDALALLPEPAPLELVTADPNDEAPHTPGEERLWNESWYFDVADVTQGIGAYVRLGLYPNLKRSWYTALVCGPGRATIALVDFAAPLPGEDLALRTETIEADQECQRPLECYRVRLRGRGESHEDPAALLRGERGADTGIELDLVWETDGEPYAYRIATRYEIACRVRGTLRVGDEEFAIDASGQRDHSWGVRDWWSMDWIWFAGRLEDGMRLHAVEVRMPGAPAIGVGYAQPPGASLAELASVRASETIGPDGLAIATHLTLDDLELDAEPLGHGPLLLQDDDGRTAQFPRAWCRLRAADGRAGTGWLEWNRSLRG